MRRLERAGIENTVNVQGGVAVLLKSGMLKTDKDENARD